MSSENDCPSFAKPQRDDAAIQADRMNNWQGYFASRFLRFCK
jgi:hypothetical protein